MTVLQSVEHLPIVEIVIDGIARPQGSKSARVLMKDGKPVLTDDGRPVVVMFEASKHLRRWRKHCRESARRQYRGEPFTGAVHCEMEFRFQRPEAHFRKAGLSRSAPRFHTSKPDLAKIVRAVEDALTGIVWADDAQVVQGRNRKTWTHSEPGVRVRIIPLTDEQQEATLW